MKYLGTNRGKVLFIGATAPRGRLIGQVGRRVITPGVRVRTHTGHLELVSEIVLTLGVGVPDHLDT